MSTESVSSDSSIQAAQLIQDQLSEDELETVVGGTLDLKSSHPNKPTPAGGGNSPMPPQNPKPTGPLGNQSKPDIYDTWTS